MQLARVELHRGAWPITAHIGLMRDLRRGFCTLVLFIFSAVVYVVGFRDTSLDITEGESIEICVDVISPPDIGDAEIYLEVLRSSDLPSGVTSASKTPWCGFFTYPPHSLYLCANNNHSPYIILWVYIAS